jgi:hypothetical protein
MVKNKNDGVFEGSQTLDKPSTFIKLTNLKPQVLSQLLHLSKINNGKDLDNFLLIFFSHHL